MKKTFYLLILASLAIVGCVATREIPLTQEPNKDFRYLAEALKNAPMLPREVGNVQYIDIPDTFKWAEKGYTSTAFCTPFTDLIDKVDMLALEPIPGISISDILDVRTDDGLLFISFRSESLLKESKDTTEYLISDRYAIFTDKGKFVALLGEPVAPSKHKVYYAGSSTSAPRQTSRNHELQYYNVALRLNRKDKEAVLVCSESQRNLHFDYKGNYLRTTYFPFSAHPLHVNNSRGKWFVNTGDGNDNNVILALDDSMKVKHQMVLGKGMAHNWLDRIDDDFYHMGNNYDTIWHITPEKAVARYVLGNNLKTKPFAITRDTVAERKALPYFKVRDGEIFANSRYLQIPIERVYDLKGKSRLSNHFFYLLDQKTGHSICYWYHNVLHPLQHTVTLQQWMMDGLTELPYILPDGRHVRGVKAYDMKKRMAHLLDQPIADREVIITKKDEKFVRSLLPNQMVLFFAKLKKF